MSAAELDKKKMHRDTMLAKIEDVAKRGSQADAPAYTLILGAGASFGIVPTAKEMLGFPDAKTRKIHDKSIPLWLARQLDPTTNFEDGKVRLQCSQEFWKTFSSNNSANNKCREIEMDEQGLPSATSIATAYQAVFETACIGGLDTPERHRNYMRAVTLPTAVGSTQLNATHFYLASLLSLQKRTGDIGADKKPLYTGRREFARTIFTTNFDPLLQTSLQLFQLLYYMTDRPEFLSADALQTDEHPAMHLFYAHGSVHRPYMANTDDQIALLKQQNARDLAAYLGNHGVIVLGYSGWDDCLLEALNQTKTFSNNLYWLARGAKSISDNVANFLKSHANAYWVEIDDAGNSMANLHGRLCPGAPNTEMLYNPIRPLISQLNFVNLTGIQGSVPPKKIEAEKMIAALDTTLDVETVRSQVIARLYDAQKLFTDPSKPGGEWGELARQCELDFANENWDAVITGYKLLIDEHSDIPVSVRALALFRRGVCFIQKEETELALAEYNSLIELQGAPPDKIAEALLNRGYCYGLKNETDKEISDYSSAIELPGAPLKIITNALYNRGICFDQLNKPELAIEDYTALIELPGAKADNIAYAQFNRAVSYGKLGDHDKEIADYTAVIELADAPAEQIARSYINRGVSYYHLKRMPESISDYSSVIGLLGAPADQVARALLARGLLHAENREPTKSIADFTSLAALPEAPAEFVQKAKDNLELVSRIP